jgi:prepilin-type N-terminal cleavage/methylation domain-containing protein
MKNVYKQKRAQGFTIIEVLIVLAIAALILLIVFLAVPSLQRNARNTQRRSDAANLGSAVANFESNANGSLPTALATGPDTKSIYLKCKGASVVSPALTEIKSVAVSTGCSNGNQNSDSAKLGYYDPTTDVYINSAAINNVAAVGAESNTAPSTNSVIVDLKYTCNSDGTATGNSTSRGVAILYAQETNGGNGNLQCIEP